MGLKSLTILHLTLKQQTCEWKPHISLIRVRSKDKERIPPSLCDPLNGVHFGAEEDLARSLDVIGSVETGFYKILASFSL